MGGKTKECPEDIKDLIWEHISPRTRCFMKTHVRLYLCGPSARKQTILSLGSTNCCIVTRLNNYGLSIVKQDGAVYPIRHPHPGVGIMDILAECVVVGWNTRVQQARCTRVTFGTVGFWPNSMATSVARIASKIWYVIKTIHEPRSNNLYIVPCFGE